MRVSGKRIAAIAGSMVIVLALQSTLFYRLKLLGIRPDLVLAIVAAVALTRGWSEGLLWGIFGGFLQDVITGSLPGSHAMAKGVAGFALGLLEGKVFRENLILPTVTVFIGGLIEGIVFFLAAGAFGQTKWRFLLAFRAAILPSAIVTAVFAPLVYLLYKRLYDPEQFGTH